MTEFIYVFIFPRGVNLQSIKNYAILEAVFDELFKKITSMIESLIMNQWFVISALDTHIHRHSV